MESAKCFMSLLDVKGSAEMKATAINKENTGCDGNSKKCGDGNSKK